MRLRAGLDTGCAFCSRSLPLADGLQPSWSLSGHRSAELGQSLTHVSVSIHAAATSSQLNAEKDAMQ